MSLYGGIKFTKAEQAVEDARVAQNAADARADAEASTSSAGVARSIKASRPRAEAFLDDPPSGSTSPAPSPAPERLKSAEKASAVLSFAPRIPKPKTAVPKPAFRATTYSAAPVLNVPSSASSDKSQSATRASVTLGEVMYGDDGKALARAPAMTLSAKPAGGWSNAADGSKKRKKKKARSRGKCHVRRADWQKRRAQLIPEFDPEEQYDPNRPNDLAEYQRYRRRVKEERRARYMEERRRQLAGESSGSSYYTDSDEEVAPRRDAPKLFAPPKQYSPPRSAGPSSARAQASEDPYALRAVPTPSTVPLSGDDAYARRLALSQQHAAPPASGDDAYARRAAMSGIRPAAPTFAPPASWAPPPQPPAFTPVPPPPPAFTPAPPPPSAFTSAPPPPTDAADFPPPPPPSTALSPPPPAPSSIPGFGAHMASSSVRPFVPPPSTLVANAPGASWMPPFPPSAPPVPALLPSNVALPPSEPAPPPVPTAEQAKFAAELEEKKQKLAAIAARFATLPNAPPPAVVFEEIEGESFANKMMRKWGHTEGSTLGNRGEGLKEALIVEHIAGQPTNPAALSKRQMAKQKAAEANMKKRKWVQHANARGKIVNAAEEERRMGEKDKYGEASRIICLLGVVGDVDEIDDDLAEDIGEECSKHGIVERVVLHMVEPPPEDPADSLRIFVVFSGMAGAWRNLKELDGRFFGGRKIRAVYYDETKFDANDRDGPV